LNFFLHVCKSEKDSGVMLTCVTKLAVSMIILYVDSFVRPRDIKGITPHFTKASLANMVLSPFATVWMDYRWKISSTELPGLNEVPLFTVPQSYPVRADVHELKPLSQLNHYLKSHS